MVRSGLSIKTALIIVILLVSVFPVTPGADGLNVATKAVNARSPNGYVDGVWDLGYTGKGVTIAIMDTGVDDEHPSLEGSYVGGTDLSAFIELPGNADDRQGHGTHCAGIALGRGGGENDLFHQYRGMAPDANLVDVKIAIDYFGFTLVGFERGIQWCIDHYDDDWGDEDPTNDGIDVISISMGATANNSTGIGSISDIVTEAVNLGMVVVTSAGNDGPDNNGFDELSGADDIITVGAITDWNTVDRADDTIAEFSNRGPRDDDGDSDHQDELKPDIVAPGVGIMSAEFGYIFTPTGYVSKSGTSMACPAVAGIVALMLEANPDLDPREIKSILRGTAEARGQPYDPTISSKYNTSYGFGLVDALEAVRAAIPMADLIVEEIDLSRDVLREGETLDIAVTVKNIGNNRTNKGKLVVWLMSSYSTSGVLSSQEFTLAAGMRKDFIMTWNTMGNASLSGIRTQLSVHDGLERNESNNQKEAEFLILPMPELEVTDYDQSSHVVWQGDPLMVNVSIANTGGNTADYSCHLWVENQLMNTPGSLSLGPGNSTVLALTIPTDQFEGTLNITFNLVLNYLAEERFPDDNWANSTFLVMVPEPEEEEPDTIVPGIDDSAAPFLIGGILIILAIALVLMKRRGNGASYSRDDYSRYDRYDEDWQDDNREYDESHYDDSKGYEGDDDSGAGGEAEDPNKLIEDDGDWGSDWDDDPDTSEEMEKPDSGDTTGERQKPDGSDETGKTGNSAPTGIPEGGQGSGTSTVPGETDTDGTPKDSGGPGKNDGPGEETAPAKMDGKPKDRLVGPGRRDLSFAPLP